jgi:hypothetical protein
MAITSQFAALDLLEEDEGDAPKCLQNHSEAKVHRLISIDDTTDSIAGNGIPDLLDLPDDSSDDGYDRQCNLKLLSSLLQRIRSSGPESRTREWRDALLPEVECLMRQCALRQSELDQARRDLSCKEKDGCVRPLRYLGTMSNDGVSEEIESNMTDGRGALRSPSSGRYCCSNNTGNSTLMMMVLEE